jgi:HEAT repeat protein
MSFPLRPEPLDGVRIAALLSESGVSGRVARFWRGWDGDRVIHWHAQTRDLAAALHPTDDPRAHNILCYELQHRDDGSLAIPALVRLLDNPCPRVRGDAADAILSALAREGADAALRLAPDLGDTLFAALEREDVWDAKAHLAGAMGELSHAPATAALIALLTDDNFLVRREAAWSLGALRAHDAATPLRQALQHESDPATADRMRTALAAITDGDASEAWPPYPWSSRAN